MIVWPNGGSGGGVTIYVSTVDCVHLIADTKGTKTYSTHTKYTNVKRMRYTTCVRELSCTLFGEKRGKSEKYGRPNTTESEPMAMNELIETKTSSKVSQLDQMRQNRY